MSIVLSFLQPKQHLWEETVNNSAILWQYLLQRKGLTMFLKLWGWSECVHTNHAQELLVTVVNLHESTTVSVLSKYSIEDFPSLHVQDTGSTSLWVDVNVGHYRVQDTNHLLNTFYYISCLNGRDPSESFSL